MITWTADPQYLRHHLLVQEVLVLLCANDAAKGDFFFVDLEGETFIASQEENHTQQQSWSVMSQYYQAA